MTYDVSSLSVETKLALRESLIEYSRQSKTEGVAMYRPHHKQDKFHRLGEFKYRYLRTGNRFGKSDCGSAEDVAHALGERSWYSKDDPARYAGIRKRCTKGLILCTDWGKVREVFTGESEGQSQGKLWKWIPKHAFVRRDTNHSGDINKITVKSVWGDESTIQIDTIAGFKINEQRGESDWYDWIHVDEPIPQLMWESFSRGLIDHDGKAWFTCTPLREPWINRFFLPSNRTILDPHEANVFTNKRGVADRVVIIGQSTDNPYVSAAGLETYMEGLDDRTRAARMFGRPIEASGAVHSMFDDRHVYTEPPDGWVDCNTPPLDYTIRYHVDCHMQTPNAVLFSATAPDGRVFFFDEIWDPSDAEIIAEQIVEKIIKRGYFVAAELMDPSGWIKWRGRDESTFADVLLEYGLTVEKASKDLLRGIQQTNIALKRPGYLNFAHNLGRTLFEFDNYVYQDPLKRPDKPKDADDHMMEGLHRLVMAGLSYIDPGIYDIEPRHVSHSLLTL